jgi:hypothetical protein
VWVAVVVCIQAARGGWSLAGWLVQLLVLGPRVVSALVLLSGFDEVSLVDKVVGSFRSIVAGSLKRPPPSTTAVRCEREAKRIQIQKLKQRLFVAVSGTGLDSL